MVLDYTINLIKYYLVLDLQCVSKNDKNLSTHNRVAGRLKRRSFEAFGRNVRRLVKEKGVTFRYARFPSVFAQANSNKNLNDSYIRDKRAKQW